MYVCAYEHLYNYRAPVLTCASGHNLRQRDEILHVNIFSTVCIVVNEVNMMTKISAVQQKYRKSHRNQAGCYVIRVVA